MNKQNLDGMESSIEKKYKKRNKKSRPAMKVSGSGVKKLYKIIQDKNKSN